MASVLFASAFTVNAQTPVEGEFVRLAVSTEFLSIGEDNALEKGSAASTTPRDYTVGTHTGTYTDVFNGVNNQLWKIAKITKTTTGQPTYQFVNKKTGEYLAIKLQTAPAEDPKDAKTVTSEDPVELSPAGNKDWAFDGDKFYAFVSKNGKDSVFYLTETGGNLYLTATAGNAVPNSATQVTFNRGLNDSPLELTAGAYNALVKLPGNDGKLHFNGKDVSDGQTNALTNVAWKAESAADDSKDLYFWNQKTTNNGTSVSGSTWTKNVKKHQYLLVDTAYSDTADKYYKLAVDTVNYELDDAQKYGKPIEKRPNETAQFTANYYFGNDSIALFAKYAPEKVNRTAEPKYNWTIFGEDENRNYASANLSTVEGLFSAAKTSLNANITNSSAVETKLQALTTALGTVWIPTTTDAGEEKTYTSAELDALNAALQSFNEETVKNYATKLATVTYKAAAFSLDGTAFNKSGDDVKAIFPQSLTVNQDKDLKTLVESYLENPGTSSFAQTTFYWNGSEGSVQVVASGTVGAHGNTGADFIGWARSANSQLDLSELEALTYQGAKYIYNGQKYDQWTDVIAELPSTDNAKWATNNDKAALLNLEQAFNLYQANVFGKANDKSFKAAGFKAEEGDNVAWGGETTGENLLALCNASASYQDAAVASLKKTLETLTYVAANAENENPWFYIGDKTSGFVSYGSVNAPVVLRDLAKTVVVTIATDGISGSKHNGYTLPLIQPYATTGGDAKIATTKYHFIQVKNEAKMPTLRAAAEAKLTNKYYVVDWTSDEDAIIATSEVSEANPFTQWAFVEGATGSYSVINRATERVLYTGPLFKVAGEEDTYTNGTDTLKVAAVEIPESAIITEGTTKYDISGQFYPGKEEELIQRLFSVSPVSPFMSQLAMQVNKDSVLILGDAADAPVWQLKQVADSKKTYGYTLDGYAPLLQVQYNIYTKDADDNVYYVINDVDGDTYGAGEAYRITKSDSKMGDTDKAAFTFYAVAPGQYLMVDEDGLKVTINPTPAKPILETSEIDSERDDYFTFTQVNQNVYRELGVSIEDNLAAKAPNVAKIFMDNEPNRFLYENTANIVANNGKGLNFLGIYNSAELTKNAALYVDTAWVDRKDNLKPLYMLALGVDTVDAKDAVACTYEHNHFDNAGNKVDAEHCSHATPATLGYKSGRYLVALNDSVPENLSKNSPVYYDGKVRLAFVDAIHYLTKDTLVIKKSKYTGNSKQQVAGEETTWAAKDTIEITKDLNAATFALRIKDQATKSFYLENANGYVRILNGVPVLEKTITDAAIFNIAATEEEATANEAIEASAVQVIAGKGVVTVQGAAGKVVTVANILGQTIANQVAASDNVTIAAPAGVLVVTVDGEATKVVVK